MPSLERALPSPNLSLRTLMEGALHPAWRWRFLTAEAIPFPNLSARAPHPTAKGQDVSQLFDGTASWADVEWIRQTWTGPLALKGVPSEADAGRAADLGVDAVIVSTHGDRQLDHVLATIDVLPGIVDAVGNRIEVLVDSEIRRGTDIVAALALGARGVLIGRAHLYGLAAAGEAGISHAIDVLADELRVATALTGARAVSDLDRASVRRRPAPS
jgi:L-lactate dehydrogenase (cytochrome)